MIEKIISIKNVGKFEDYSASGDVTFRGLTLIYGENASGKTTLSAIFRSLQTGEALPIEERQRLAPQPEPPSVEMLVDGRAFTYEDARWSESLPNMEIFDERFVTENVYSGDAVGPEQRHSLHGFAIGAAAAQSARSVDLISKKILKINPEITTAEQMIRNEIVESMDVDGFVALKRIDNADQVIVEKEEEVKGLKKAGEITERALLSPIGLPVVPIAEFTSLLGKTLPDVSDDAERKVRQHLDGCMKEGDEPWVSQGMTYIKDDLCPFCGRPLSGVDLIAAYRDYFSETYDAFKDEIEEGTRKAQETLSEAALLGLQGSINGNLTLGQFWKDHVNSEAPSISFDELKPVWSRLRECLVASLEKKAAGPLEKVTASDELRKAQAGFEEVRGQVSAYNKKVCGINEAITTKKAQVSSGSLAVAEAALATLKNRKRRHDERVAKVCSKYLGLKKEKKELEAKKEKERKSLEKETQDLLTQYEERINQCLGRFGADFRLQGTSRGQVQGISRIEYELQINGQSVPLKRREGYEAEPFFGNTLSSGDKTTLALAFFLARLERDGGLAEKIIVLDDPLSSLDDHRRTRTQQEITRLACDAKQLVLLSHDPYFLKRVWSSRGKPAASALCVKGSGTANIIASWDIEWETKEKYFQDCTVLKEYLDGKGTHKPSHVASLIRPVLERNLCIRFPGELSADLTLGQMIARIRNAEVGNKLVTVAPVEGELSAINEYSTPYVHGEREIAEKGPLNEQQLRTYVGRTLGLLSGVLEDGAAPA